MNSGSHFSSDSDLWNSICLLGNIAIITIAIEKIEKQRMKNQITTVVKNASISPILPVVINIDDNTLKTKNQAVNPLKKANIHFSIYVLRIENIISLLSLSFM
jgi:hypothetical protein